jgi:hypothetical protein
MSGKITVDSKWWHRDDVAVLLNKISLLERKGEIADKLMNYYGRCYDRKAHEIGSALDMTSCVDYPMDRVKLMYLSGSTSLELQNELNEINQKLSELKGE